MILELLHPVLQNRIGAVAIIALLTVVWGLLAYVAWLVIEIARNT